MANIKSTLAQKYGYETVYAEVDDEDDEVYNDEYDDTYDTINVGADDADSADELSQRRYMYILSKSEKLSKYLYFHSAHKLFLIKKYMLYIALFNDQEF